MADDKAKTTEATGAVPEHRNTEPEARIIEEIIVRPASAPTRPPVPGTAPPPKVTPPAPISPQQEKTVPAPPVPAITFGSFTPNNLGVALEQKSPTPPAREIPPTPVPVAAPLPRENAAAQPPPFSTRPAPDVPQILQGIKLPERHVVPGSTVPQAAPRTYDTSLGSMISDDDKKTVVTPQTGTVTTGPQKQKDDEDHPTFVVAPVRTLKNDFQDIVRDKKMSYVRAASLEQDKKRDRGRVSELETKTPPSRRTFMIIFGAILFLVLGSATLFGISVIMQERSGTVATPDDTSLLFTESAVTLPLENLSAFDVKSLLSQMRGASGALGSITRVIPTIRGGLLSGTEGDTAVAREASLEEFLSALGAHASSNLIRALDDTFFFGIHTVDKNAPVFVIPVLSYERAFAGMLEWEGAMNADLTPAFTSVPSTIMGENGILEKRQFEDVIMRNYDTRALKDNSGTIQLFYSFPTRNILIIAESPYSFVEVLARLRAERKL